MPIRMPIPLRRRSGRPSLPARPVAELLEGRRLLSGAAATQPAPLSGTGSAAMAPLATTPARQMENLGRGLVAVSQGNGRVYVGWRLLGTDPGDVAFNVYRATGTGSPVKLTPTPVTASTNYVDATPDLTSALAYTVRPVVNGVEQAAGGPVTLAANAPVRQYLPVPIHVPPPVTTADGVVHTYHANDASAGDLDGDGEYELVLKWESTASAATTHNVGVYLDALRTDGTRMWRAYSGKNIKTGAQFLQFIVYDLDGDGRAEVAFNSADGAVSGAGQVIGDAARDWRNTASGYVTTGPEYLTLLDGRTGAILANTNLAPARGAVTDWGDDYGHRGHTFNAGVAYVDGRRPSLIFGRGIYHGRDGLPGKTQIVAWDWRGGQLAKRWTFTAAANGANPAYVGQGNHNITIGDVDGDGRDEVVWGAMAVDDDGAPLYTTRLGHGDALHMSDMDPGRPGLEVFGVHESPGEYTRDVTGDGMPESNGGALRDARTGQVLVSVDGFGADVGRGVAMDIDPRPGYEMWTSANGNIYNVDGTVVAAKPSNMFVNFGVWWDADPYRELLDETTIGDWNHATDGRQNFDLDPSIGGVQQYAPGAASNNGTKSTPALSGDLFGDWREEVVWRNADSTELRIFTTVIPAATRLYTLMHDPMYRVAVAGQQNYYNQPPHPGFFLGDGMAAAPTPNIYAAVPAAVPTGLTAAVAGGPRVDLAWAASSGAATYNVKRAEAAGGPYATVAAGVAGTTYADAAVKGGGTYHYVVSAVNAGGGESGDSAPAAAAVPLPATWVAQDVGAAGWSGSTTYGDGVFTVRAGGADIWAAADEFRFTHQRAGGDVTALARVTSLTNTNTWAKAGVMIRAGTEPGAAHAMVVQTPAGNGVAFQWRAATGGPTQSANVAGVPVGSWVRLTRTGNTFSGHYSTDGTTWVQVGATQPLSIPATALAGLAVTSHDGAALTTATFAGAAVTLPSAATLESFAVEDGAAQRSRVTRLTVAFDRPAGLLPGAFDLRRPRDAYLVPLTAANPSGDGRTYVLTFGGDDVVAGSLADGVYDLTVRADRVRDASDRPLAGGDRSFPLHRLFGDADGDRDVDSLDSRRFRAALGTDASMAGYNPIFDFELDGDVDSLDSRRFRARLGTGI